MLQELERKQNVKLAAKLPSWKGCDISIPQSLNLEQCSSEVTARYKASLAGSGLRVADLTGGLGADSWAFSLVSEAVWYNERNEGLSSAVARNFSALGVKNVLFNTFDIGSDIDDWRVSLKGFAPDLIYLDPARRSASGKKVFLLEDCSPDVPSLMPVLLDLAPRVMVKVSPMADLTMLERRFEGVLESLHVVGADGECKEILCCCSRHPSEVPETVLFENGLTLSGPWDTAFPEPIEHGDSQRPEPEFLFVPSAALTKSGMGPGICLCAYNEQLAHFGKFYKVIENLPFSSSEIKSLGRRYSRAEVSARGVSVSSEDLRRRLGVKSGGPVHVFACNIAGQRRLIVTLGMLLIHKQMFGPKQVV